MTHTHINVLSSFLVFLFSLLLFLLLWLHFRLWAGWPHTILCPDAIASTITTWTRGRRSSVTPDFVSTVWVMTTTPRTAPHGSPVVTVGQNTILHCTKVLQLRLPIRLSHGLKMLRLKFSTSMLPTLWSYPRPWSRPFTMIGPGKSVLC